MACEKRAWLQHVWRGVAGKNTAHYLEVWIKCDDCCKVTTKGFTNSKGKFTWTTFPVGYEVTVTESMGVSPREKCRDGNMDCYTVKSEFVAYFGLKSKWIDVTMEFARSSLSITLCCDGSVRDWRKDAKPEAELDRGL